MSTTPVENYSNLFPLRLERVSYGDVRPYAAGRLEVGDGHWIYWETCGNPDGKPVLVVHGGPGSGATPYWRQFFNPELYRIILFDQRGCGRSQPNAGSTEKALLANTTKHLISDMEKIRTMLQVDKWMLFAGSWGSTLSLAYAVTHPNRVTELILWGVATTRKQEVDWLTWGMGHIFPQEFAELLSTAEGMMTDGNIPLAYNKLLTAPEPEIHMPASWAWCAWEDRIVNLGNRVRPSERYLNDRFRLCFARLVTHYFGNYAFLPDDYISGNLLNIKDTPMVMVRGRLDISSQLSIAWALHKQHPLSDLYLVGNSGHGGAEEMHRVLVGATDYFAAL